MRSFRHQRLVIVGMISLFTFFLFLYYSTLSSSTNTTDLIENERKTPIKILFWTKVFNDPPVLNDYCPLKEPCVWSTNRQDFRSADAVVFHAHDIQRNDLPRFRSTNPLQKYVLYSQEAFPSLNKISHGTFWKDVLKFHWVLSYMKSAHIQQPYGGFLVNPELGRQHNFKPIGNFTKESVMKDKQNKRAVWFVSNCESEERLKVANELKKHFHVDIGGKCSPDNKNLCPKGQNCDALIRQYYFYLAFENENCIDYVTEKFHNLLSLPIVPVVMKRSVYKAIVPSNAFIAVDDFSSAQKLAEHLNYLIQNTDEYFTKHFEWRNQWTRADWNSDGYRLGLCALCEKMQKEYSKEAELINNLKQWYEENSKCSAAVSPEWYN